MTKGWIDLKKAEKKQVESVSFEQDNLTYLNNFCKTEIKIVKLPTNLRDRVSEFARIVGSKDTNNKGHRCSCIGDNHKVEIFKKDGTSEVYLLTTNGKEILNIAKKEPI